MAGKFDIRIEQLGAGRQYGYHWVDPASLPKQRFASTGGVVKTIVSELDVRGFDTADIYATVNLTDLGLWVEMFIDAVDGTMSLGHRGHSDMANRPLEQVVVATGWTTVTSALLDFKQMVESRKLEGEELSEYVAGEMLPRLRAWQEALTRRDEMDMRLFGRLAASIENTVGLEMSVTINDPEDGPLDEELRRILRSDDPLDVMLDPDVIESSEYF